MVSVDTLSAVSGHAAWQSRRGRVAPPTRLPHEPRNCAQGAHGQLKECCTLLDYG